MQPLIAYAAVAVAAIWLLRRYVPWRRLRPTAPRAGERQGCGPDCGCS